MTTYLTERSGISDVKVEVIEETDEEKLVREIMEEPQDEIKVRVTACIHVQVEYISVQLKFGDKA